MHSERQNGVCSNFLHSNFLTFAWANPPHLCTSSYHPAVAVQAPQSQCVRWTPCTEDRKIKRLDSLCTKLTGLGDAYCQSSETSPIPGKSKCTFRFALGSSGQSRAKGTVKSLFKSRSFYNNEEAKWVPHFAVPKSCHLEEVVLSVGCGIFVQWLLFLYVSHLTTVPS